MTLGNKVGSGIFNAVSPFIVVPCQLNAFNVAWNKLDFEYVIARESVSGLSVKSHIRHFSTSLTESGSGILFNGGHGRSARLVTLSFIRSRLSSLFLACYRYASKVAWNGEVSPKVMET